MRQTTLAWYGLFLLLAIVLAIFAVCGLVTILIGAGYLLLGFARWAT